LTIKQRRWRKEGGGAGKTIHTYTANPEFPHRDFIKCGK